MGVQDEGPHDLTIAESTRELASEDFLFHLYRGSELLQDNRVGEAKEELEQALQLQPRDPKGQDLLAVVYFRLGMYPRAIQIYEILVRDNPHEPALMVNLALCYLKTGQSQSARIVLEDLVRVAPDHRRAWGYLGLAHERMGDLEKAEQAFERAGHAQMAKRVAERRVSGPRTDPDPVPPAEAAQIRRAAAAAFQELDAGELSFALAEPTARRSESGTWRAVEIGEAVKTVSQPPPPPQAPTMSVPAQEGRDPIRAPRALQQSLRDGRIHTPPNEDVGTHTCGLIVVHGTGDGETFAARLEALRSYAGSLTTRVLERQSRTPSHEPFGGIGSPLLRLTVGGTVLFGPRPGHRLVPFKLQNEQVFLREDVILGFELQLAYENGKLPFSEGEAMHVVQLKGSGTVVIELLDPWVTLEATADRSVTVRRESLVGWIGRLVPRTLPPQEAPSGQRGLVVLVGEGTVLVSGR
jgi:DNA-binding SARP family transcriptional activator